MINLSKTRIDFANEVWVGEGIVGRIEEEWRRKKCWGGTQAEGDWGGGGRLFRGLGTAATRAAKRITGERPDDANTARPTMSFSA